MISPQKAFSNQIRTLGIDMINAANSGHPGIVLGAAPIMSALFYDHLNILCHDPKWLNRDRFVLSAGHGSALLYAVNFLVGYNKTLANLKNFRKIGNTPGHPEFGETDGVEATTGPLGQGIGNAVGLALASKHLQAKLGKSIINNFVYVLCGDGDLQEGVALEALSFAGHNKLNNLIILFDSNDIQLDGATTLATSDNIKQKFTSMGFNYILVEQGDDEATISNAISKAKKSLNKPTVIEIKTIIGAYSSFAGQNKVHGTPLKSDEILLIKQKLNVNKLAFHVDTDLKKNIQDTIFKRTAQKKNNFDEHLTNFLQNGENKNYYHDLFFGSFNNCLILKNIQDNLATRESGGLILKEYCQALPFLIGGSADLASSTKVKGVDGNFSSSNYAGRNICFGVREHAMGAIANGVTLFGPLKCFTGGFLVFVDYMKAAIRVAALSKLPTIFIFTHDSICVGEDGPTHQPIEQLVSLRTIPNLNVIRPADKKETLMAYEKAVTSQKTPTAIILTRQSIQELPNSNYHNSFNGGYIVDENPEFAVILLSSGSEVAKMLDIKNDLLKFNIKSRVVSMPSQFMFEKQTNEYKNLILPKNKLIIAFEFGSSYSWYKYTKHVIGIDNYAFSDQADNIIKALELDQESILKKVLKIINE